MDPVRRREFGRDSPVANCSLSRAFCAVCKLRPNCTIVALEVGTWASTSLSLSLSLILCSTRRNPQLKYPAARRLPRFLHDHPLVSCSIVESINQITMPLRRPLISRAFPVLLFSSILLSWFPGSIMSATVTLDSIKIFNSHEWIPTKPTFYFQCKEENKTYLPDVKETHVSYTFKGEESWQPLTEFPNTKCKRCGFYEEDILKSDEFDEWEFCPSDFTNPDGSYNKFKVEEFNATFLCPDCVPLGSDSNHASASHNGGKGMHVAIVILISALVSTVFILGLAAAYKYWQKRKREQEQARFLKLFEEGDDIEDELGLGPLDGVI